jgi:hypothetical protein
VKIGDLVKHRGTYVQYGVILDKEYSCYNESINLIYWFHESESDWYDDDDLEVISASR